MSNPYALKKIQTEVVNTEQHPTSIPQFISRLAHRSLFPPKVLFRRAFFVWVKIFVDDKKKNTKVNLRIPLPIPLVGLLLRKKLSFSQANTIASLLREGNHDDPKTWQEVSAYLDSLSGADLLRVEEKNTVVVIGLE